MERIKQKERILVHLQLYGSITSDEAQRFYGIARLASRIAELRKRGFPIESETECGLNRYGEKCRYSRYYFGEVNECRTE